MTLTIPATTLTANYQQLGGASLYGSGYLLIANGPADIQILYGRATGQAGATVVPNVSSGQYEFVAPPKNLITGLQVRAAGGVLTTPPQVVQGAMFEPGVPGLIPVGSGIITTTPGGGGLQLIQQNDLTVSGVFSSIPTDFTHLVLRLLVRSAAAAGSDILNLQFNGDNGLNYEWAATEGTAAGAVSSTGGGGVNSIQLQGVPGAASNAGRAASITVDINYYLQTVLDKGVSYRYPSQDGVNVYSIQGGGQWRNTAAIASLALNLSTGPYAAGSFASLYGL